MMKSSKRKCQIKHARRRFQERCAVDRPTETMEQIIKDIHEGRAEFYYKQSNRVTLWRVPINNETRTVVYDKHRRTIVTVLPREGET